MGQVVPTRENCDPSDPRQRFQWVFVQLPFIGNTPFTPSDELLEQWSEHLCKLGFETPDPARAEIKLLAPRRGPDHTLNGAMGWVPADEPDPDPTVIPDMGLYTRHEQEIVAEHLRYHGVVEGRPEAGPAKAVAHNHGELFDPGCEAPAVVNGYLRGCAANGNEREMRRVIAAEMAGQARSRILKQWPGV